MARPRKPWFRRQTGDWCVTVDGKQVPLAKGEHNRVAAVKEFHRLMSLRDEPDATAPPGSVVTLLGEFLTWLKRNKSAATYEQRRHFLKSFVKHPGVRALAPHKVTVGLVERWLDAHPGWKASRRHAVLSLLRAFNWAVKRDRLGKNPVVGIEVPKQRRVLSYLTADQRKAVYDATKDLAFRRFLTALQETGCRQGEVRAVEAKDVNLEAGVWVLPKHKTGERTGKPRTVFLTDAMLSLTKELVALRPAGPLFLNSRGRPWTRNAVRCRFRKLRERFPEFGRFTATSFRRAYVTDALERGLGVAQVAELVGHTSTDMVMRHYSQLQERVAHMREMANRVTG